VKRDLKAFYAYRLLATAFVFVPVEVPYLARLGLSFTEILGLQSLYSTVVILLEVPAGALADRYGRRYSLMAGSLLSAMGSLLFYGGGGLAVCALAQVCLAAGMTLVSGADSAWLYDRLASQGDDGRYFRSEGVATAMKHLGTALAFGVGGFLGLHDLAFPYLVTAAASLCAATAAAFLGEPARSVPPRSPAGLVGDLGQALRAAWTQGRLRWAILYSAFVFVLLRISLWLYQPYLTKAGFGLAEIGLIFASMYLVAALASRSAEFLKSRFQGPGLYLMLPLTLGASYLVLGTVTSSLCVPLLMAQKAIDGLYSPLTKNLIQREVPSAVGRATVLSVESLVRRVVFSLFAPLVGLLVDTFSLGAALWACAGVAAMGGAAVLGVRRTVLAQAVQGPAPGPEGG